MTAFIATTLVNVLRGSGTDGYGDEIDKPIAISFDNPAAVSEGFAQAGGQRWFRPAEQRGTLVETYTVRLRSDVDVVEGDRLHDTCTNFIYLVTDVIRPQSVVGFADVRVQANRVGSASQPVNG